MSTKQVEQQTDRSLAGKLAVAAVQNAIQGPANEGGNTWRELFYNILAVIAMLTSAAAIGLEGGILVTTVSVICGFLGPSIAMKQSRLSDLDSMRAMTQDLRDKVDELSSSNSKLEGENKSLKESAERLEKVESTLEELSKTQGKSVDSLIEHIEEYKKIQNKIKESLEAKVVQNVISVVMLSDDDEDYHIDKEEIEPLMRRLKSIDGVDFSVENLKKALAKAGHNVDKVFKEKGGFGLPVVIEVMKNLLDKKTPSEDNIFTIDTDRAVAGLSGEGDKYKRSNSFIAPFGWNAKK